MASPRKKSVPTPEATVPIPEEWLGKIHQGDCVQTLSQIPDGCVHLAFADPPFNIGYEYDGTRHNIGFEAVDFLCKSLEGSWHGDHHGELAEVKYKGRTLILLKPNTYMNLSGKAVRYWLQKEKILVENSLVILDDLNLEFGKQRLRAKGSDGGHNGLKHIQEVLATDAYPRLRIGIGDNFSKGKQVNYVLGKWSEGEKAELPRILEKAAEVVKTFVTIGLERAMNVTGK